MLWWLGNSCSVKQWEAQGLFRIMESIIGSFQSPHGCTWLSKTMQPQCETVHWVAQLLPYL